MYIKNITKEKKILLSDKNKNCRTQICLVIICFFIFLACENKLKSTVKAIKLNDSTTRICESFYNKRNKYLKQKLERCEYKLKDILRSSYKER